MADKRKPFPEPEPAPASEAQAPAVSDERPKCPDCNSVGMSHCSDPEHCGGVYWPDSKYQALRDELAQLRARVAILDAQEVRLPELKPYRGWLSDATRERERQLLDALRALQAKARELEVLWAAHGRLIEAFNVEQEKAEARCKAGDGLCRLLKLIRHAPHPMPPKSELSDELIDKALAAYDALAGKGE